MGMNACAPNAKALHHSNQPKLERETGIEPAPLAWKAKVLPLNYSRLATLLMLGAIKAAIKSNSVHCHNDFATLLLRPSMKISRLVERAGFEPAYS